MIIIDEIRKTTNEFTFFDCLQADRMVFRLNLPLWYPMDIEFHNIRLQVMEETDDR